LAAIQGGGKGTGPTWAKKRGERAGGEEKGGAPVGPKQKKAAREKGEKRKKKRWAGLKGVRGKKKSFFSNFRKGFQTLSI